MEANGNFWFIVLIAACACASCNAAPLPSPSYEEYYEYGSLSVSRLTAQDIMDIKANNTLNLSRKNKVFRCGKISYIQI